MQHAFAISVDPCRDDEEDLFDWQPEPSKGSKPGAGKAKRARKQAATAGGSSASAGAVRKRAKPEAPACTGLKLHPASNACRLQV